MSRKEIWRVDRTGDELVVVDDFDVLRSVVEEDPVRDDFEI